MQGRAGSEGISAVYTAGSVGGPGSHSVCEVLALCSFIVPCMVKLYIGDLCQHWRGGGGQSAAWIMWIAPCKAQAAYCYTVSYLHISKLWKTKKDLKYVQNSISHINKSSPKTLIFHCWTVLYRLHWGAVCAASLNKPENLIMCHP